MGDEDEEQSEATKVFVTMWNELRPDQRAEVMLEFTQAIIENQSLVNMIVERAGVNDITDSIKSMNIRLNMLEAQGAAKTSMLEAQKQYRSAMGVY